MAFLETSPRRLRKSEMLEQMSEQARGIRLLPQKKTPCLWKKWYAIQNNSNKKNYELGYLAVNKKYRLFISSFLSRSHRIFGHRLRIHLNVGIKGNTK